MNIINKIQDNDQDYKFDIADKDKLWIKLNDKINFYNNTIGKIHIKNINFNVGNDINNVYIKKCDNVLLQCKNINEFTNYNIDHLFAKFYKTNDLSPTIDTYNMFLEKKSNKDNCKNIIFIHGTCSCSLIFYKLISNWFASKF
jgi:hypothetical protein